MHTNDNDLLTATVHAAKGVVLRHCPDARAFYLGDGEWGVYATPRADEPFAFGPSVAMAWQAACEHVEIEREAA